jgi:hypothetical protein
MPSGVATVLGSSPEKFDAKSDGTSVYRRLRLGSASVCLAAVHAVN